MRYPNPTKLTAKVKQARGKNKEKLRDELYYRRIASLDNELKILSKKQDEIQKEIYKIQDRKAFVAKEYFEGN